MSQRFALLVPVKTLTLRQVAPDGGAASTSGPGLDAAFARDALDAAARSRLVERSLRGHRRAAASTSTGSSVCPTRATATSTGPWPTPRRALGWRRRTTASPPICADLPCLTPGRPRHRPGRRALAAMVRRGRDRDRHHAARGGSGRRPRSSLRTWIRTPARGVRRRTGARAARRHCAATSTPTTTWPTLSPSVSARTRLEPWAAPRSRRRHERRRPLGSPPLARESGLLGGLLGRSLLGRCLLGSGLLRRRLLGRRLLGRSLLGRSLLGREPSWSRLLGRGLLGAEPSWQRPSWPEPSWPEPSSPAPSWPRPSWPEQPSWRRPSWPTTSSPWPSWPPSSPPSSPTRSHCSRASRLRA